MTTEIEVLLKHIAAQNETIIEQNTKILTLLALHAVENVPKPDISSKPKSN